MPHLFSASKYVVAFSAVWTTASAVPSPNPTPTAAPQVSFVKRERYLLTCQEVRARTRLFLDLHLVYKEFTEELSRRTFAKIFEILDPERMFFSSEDIDQFKPVEDRLNALVSRKNCSFIDGINTLFVERVKERAEALPQILQKIRPPQIPDAKAEPPTKRAWTKNHADLDERWAQKIAADSNALLENGFRGNATERLAHRYAKQMASLTSRSRDEIYSDFLNSFALALDPHSAHFLPLDQDEFNSRLGNPVEGVGLTFTDDTDTITIESIAKGSSADKAGVLKVGDELVSVDNLDGSQPTNVSGFDVSKAARLMRGKKDSKVKLTFWRHSSDPKIPLETINVILRREVSRLKSILVRSALVDIRGHKIGLVKLPTFYTDLECRNRMLTSCQGSAMDIRSEIDRLRDARAEGMLLDLRNNNGGDLQESIRIAGLFITSGPILQIVDRTGAPRIQMDPDPRVSFTGPLVILINKNSASASEIVAAALKDHGRAVIVGDSRTFGKGTIQIIQDLDSPSAKKREGMLKITQATFYGPNGKSTQKRGVESDVMLPSQTEFEEETESEKDFAFDAPTIKPAPEFKAPSKEFGQFVLRLKEKSADRVSKNQAFAEVKTRMREKRNHVATKETLNEESFPAPSDIQIQETLEILADSLEKPNP